MTTKREAQIRENVPIEHTAQDAREHHGLPQEAQIEAGRSSLAIKGFPCQLLMTNGG